jgi:uroporphyrin-3 C-methyltransferase
MGSGAVAWIALFVSLALVVVVAAFAYLSYRDAAGDAAQSSTEINTLRASIGATQDALTSLEQRIATLGESDAEKDAAIDSISRQLNERLRQLESVPGRLSAVESSMATIQGISTGARNAWLLAEAEYYMQIANAQLQLANNPELAGLALTHADDRITQLADPRLTNVRQALADELRALKAIDRPDTAGITLTLASLAGVVDSLPLRQEVVVSEDRSAEIDPELSGMDRAIASLKNAVGGVVSVRRTDEAMQPLIAPEAQYFLRANLALQLQAARLALLRGEESIFRQSLDDADSWLEEYYDPSSTGVQDARKTVAEMRDSVLSVAMPDISGSLRLLRQFGALDESTPADDTEPAQ